MDIRKCVERITEEYWKMSDPYTPAMIAMGEEYVEKYHEVLDRILELQNLLKARIDSETVDLFYLYEETHEELNTLQADAEFFYGVNLLLKEIEKSDERK